MYKESLALRSQYVKHLNNILMKICKIITFEAAHQLPPDNPVYGKCRQLHGHTYKLEVTVDGDVDELGWVMNFSTLKEILKEHVTDQYDHQSLNDFLTVPTAENMVAIIINDILQPLRKLDTGKLNTVTVRLWETPTCWAEKTKSI